MNQDSAESAMLSSARVVRRIWWFTVSNAVGFLSGLTLAILKDAGIRPEVTKELLRGEERQDVALDGLEKGGRDGVKGQVVAWLDITHFCTSSGERGVKWVRPTEVGVVVGRIGVKEE